MALTGAASITAGAAAGPATSAGVLQALALLTQLRHHPARLIGQPLASTDAIESKGGQHGQALLAGEALHGVLQITPQPGGKAIQTLLQAQLRQKAGAVELGNQPLQPCVVIPSPQLCPARLLRQQASPVGRLVNADPSRLGRRPWLALKPFITIEQAAKPQHLLLEGGVFLQQGIQVAGDRPRPA